MNTYMVNIELINPFSEEFIQLIPKQRFHINKLMDNGKVLHYALSIDRKQLWVTVSADSETDAMDIIASFPLIDFMKPEFTELMFFNSIPNGLPKLIMN